MRLTIEKLVYGGAGLARTEHGVVFVPRTAPGDVVEAELVERKTDYALGRVTSLLEPSPDRQVPACPNYENAGCCHWQHIRYSRQLEIKEAILRETLQRIGRVTWEAPITTLSGPDLAYRFRASFHVNKRKLGFMAEGSHTIVPVLGCSALTAELNAFIAEANEILATPFLELIHPDDRESTQAEVEALYSGRDTIQFENRFRCKDGSYRWILWSCPAVPEGEPYICVPIGNLAALTC